MIHWVTFYTTPSMSDGISMRYCSMANALKESMGRITQRVDVVDLGERSSWMRSCLQRSTRLANMWGMVGMPDRIGMLDSDIVPLSKFPSRWDCFSEDLLLVDNGIDKPRSKRYSAGIVAFNGMQGRNVLSTWSRLCREDKSPTMVLREQAYLLEAIEQHRPSIHVISPEEHYVPKHGEVPPWPKSAILLHVPASRDMFTDQEKRQ